MALSSKKITKLVHQNSDLLEALAEFDRTGHLRKINVKERANFTLDAELMRRFRSYCRQHSLKMSQVLEKMLKKELKI